jgi:phosphate transport system protein
MWESIKNLWKADNLLDDAWKQSFEMLEICQTMFLEAIQVLRKQKKVKGDEKIRRNDKIVNKYERQVRKKVMTHLTASAPHGLAESLVLISIVIDIERLGDYTKNIIELATFYEHPLHGGIFEDKLKKVEKAVKENFRKTIECVTTSDQETADQLLIKYKWVNPLCDECLKNLITEHDKKIPSGQASALSLYFRWLKRVNSHLRNILTSVINPFNRIGFEPKK